MRSATPYRDRLQEALRADRVAREALAANPNAARPSHVRAVVAEYLDLRHMSEGDQLEQAGRRLGALNLTAVAAASPAVAEAIRLLQRAATHAALVDDPDSPVTRSTASASSAAVWQAGHYLAPFINGWWPTDAGRWELDWARTIETDGHWRAASDDPHDNGLMIHRGR